jgi:hypothetical protein
MQSEMFPVQAQSIVISATLTFEEGWHLQVAVRREGERWTSSSPWTHYDRLTSGELLDVLLEEVAGALQVL